MTEVKGLPIPKDVSTRIQRGRSWMQRDASKRRLCQRFTRGEQYWFLTKNQGLAAVSSPQNPTRMEKPAHRIRNNFNFIGPIIQGKVSLANQRIPSYEVLPSTNEAGDIGAAKVAEKVALYGYDKWRIKDAFIRASTLAIGGGGEGFLYPYFDPNVGPFTRMEEGEDGKQILIGAGEIKVAVLSGNEVSWEPGVEFHESRWYMIERARPVEEVEKMPGFIGVKLSADTSADLPTESKLVRVTEYLERPSATRPLGRRIITASGQIIVDYRKIKPESKSMFEPYPFRISTGEIIDEPVLHPLRWNRDATGLRDLGLTWQLIDPQRTITDCWNKLLEWKNLVLHPRMLSPRGARMNPPTDEPGGVDQYDAQENIPAPQWRDVPTSFASPLFQMLDAMKRDMREMAFDDSIEADANVAARTVTAVLEQSQAKWANFMTEIADTHSRVMRHCLMLVQVHYTEPRKIAISGRWGPESIADFMGKDLSGQVDVRVLPGSLDFQTRAALEQRVTTWAANGWITPQEAMLAITNGTSAGLSTIELDVAKIDRIIQRMRDNTLMSMPPRLEQVDGASKEIPGWMPMDRVDNLDVWRKRITDWMKTTEFENIGPRAQNEAKLILGGISELTLLAEQREAASQQAKAADLGMKNAAKTGIPRPLPTPPGEEENTLSPTGLPSFEA